MTRFPISGWDRFLFRIAPKWSFERMRYRRAAELLARNYEAALPGRRTSGYSRNTGDQNTVATRAISELRLHARDLIRNNAHAARAQQVIANNVVGWGIVAKPRAKAADKIKEAWKTWAETTQCDANGALTLAGIQRQVIEAVVESGEVLVRRINSSPDEGLAIPLQLQVLESDYLDTAKEGNGIIQGVELADGKPVAYWLFDNHPGSGSSGDSRRVPATEIAHIFRKGRPGQVRGVSWFANTIAPLKDFDEYEDATLMKQKIAACFAAFVEDTDGTTTAIGEEDEDDTSLETFEPGMISYLPSGKKVTIANPPSVSEHDSFTKTNLRKIAQGLGISYEDLTGDYSQVNFSSARMSRIAHYQNVHNWRYNVIIPQFCDRVWAWAMEQLTLSENAPRAEWTCPPMPMIEPDKEGLAYQRLVRTGVLTHDEMIREQGGDPDAHWQEYADGLKRLDDLGIQLDSDVRKVSQAGLTQVRAGISDGAPASTEADRAIADLTRSLMVKADEN